MKAGEEFLDIREYLFVRPTRLNSVRSLRDETFGLLDYFDSECLTRAPVVLLKDSKILSDTAY